ADAVAEISGERTIDEVVFVVGPVGSEIRSCCRIIEVTQQAADLRASAPRSKRSAFTKELHLRRARGAAVSEYLNDPCNRVAAIDCTFRPTYNLYFVYIVEREVGKIHSVAWFIDRRSVHQHFRIGGISSTEEDRCRAAFGSCAPNGNSRGVLQRVHQQL